MKSNRHPHPSRAAREPKHDTTQHYEPALRACEAAADQLKRLGDDLAASWAALCHQISTGVSSTDLLRKRAWCNVLELRLKEQAQALEQARHGVDAVWEELMLSARAQDMFHRLLGKHPANGDAQAADPSFLARTAAAMGSQSPRAMPSKK